MEGKSFVLLGVNGDDSDSVETLKQKNDKQQITWRSFRNNRGGKGPAISEEWALQGWPTLYVIDAKGIIREKWLGSPQPPDKIDEAIERLLKESESKGDKKDSK
jgi:hypothetical protein